MQAQNRSLIKLALPKGRMYDGILALLNEAGIKLRANSRNYRPGINLEGFETKILKPQNVVEMLHVGSRDVGFAGADWVAELNANVVELLDTGLDPVRVVAAAPKDILIDSKLPPKKLVIASEYERLARKWIEEAKLDASFVKSYGATEVFPPEDADCIVDNTATGSTLRANQLQIVEEVMQSSTRLYANPKALENKEQKAAIDKFVLLLKSVLDARKRVMLEVNVSEDNLERLVKLLPCMRRPTISTLYGDKGYAVKAAVLRSELPILIPQIKECGATDLVVTAPDQLIP